MLTLSRLKKAWLHDVGYVRIAEELCLDPDMVRTIYSRWNEESMTKLGWSYP